MDVDFCPPRLRSAKQMPFIHHAYLNSSDSIDDSEGDDDTRACLPCPFCYIGIEVHALCSHLQEEHCFDLKNAVCPLCAASLGKDVTGHFIAQHTTSIKRRKRHQKSGVLTGGSPMLVKELSSFLGSPTSKRGNADKNPLNSLIPPYLYSTTYSDTKGMQQDSSTGDSAFVPSVVKSYDPPEVDEDNIESKEERRRKVAFVQELIMSTIF